MKIHNLYSDRKIQMFRECWAMEKVHGTSAHIKISNNKIIYFSGGESHDRFVSLFNETDILERHSINKLPDNIYIHGEAYGEKQQGMSDTYGKELRFIAFDVKVGDGDDKTWFDIPQAEIFCNLLNIEFVPYWKVNTTNEALDEAKDRDSEVAKRRGIESPKKMEGVVLRPLIEMYDRHHSRIICKHKRDDFRETKSKRSLTDEEVKILTDAEEIADEWITEMRINHIVGKFPEVDITMTGKIIKMIVEDVLIEGKGEFIESHAVTRALSKKAGTIFKQMLIRGDWC
jgi:hypothetical protein